MAATPTAATSAPDSFLLDQLTDLYGPVFFPHKLHAEMEGMAQGCDVCHHHNPEGKVLACRECHGGSSNPEHLGQPGLKGAYHRQCLSCHREWSHSTDCAVCHAHRGAGQVAPVTPESTDIMGRLHPNIEPPGKWVYQTPDMEEGPIVTFLHKEHIGMFGLKCVECHRRENCSRCHGGQPVEAHVRSDPHEDCVKCHDVSDNCALCHAKEEKAGFDHGVRSGFALKLFHQTLKCSQCHPGGREFAPLDPACSNCHGAEWLPEKFDHALAGLILDETHTVLGCKDCHTSGLGHPPACADCHDDGRKPPESLPGKRVKP
jgi:hypothetical protein